MHLRWLNMCQDKIKIIQELTYNLGHVNYLYSYSTFYRLYIANTNPLSINCQ